jgi:uncharacterized paraquat-inducible protein A
VSLKYGLILTGILLIIRILNSYISLKGSLSLFGVASYVLLIAIIVIAHKEFKRKNENNRSFKDAMLIGLIVIGISMITLMIYDIFNYEFFIKEEIQSFYSLFFSGVALRSFVQIGVLYMLIKFEEGWGKTPTPITDDPDYARCSVCNTVVISKAMAVQTGNFNDSDRTCYNCGTVLCFRCAANEGFRRNGSRNTLNCPKCGANLSA